MSPQPFSSRRVWSAGGKHPSHGRRNDRVRAAAPRSLRHGVGRVHADRAGFQRSHRPTLPCIAQTTPHRPRDQPHATPYSARGLPRRHRARPPRNRARHRRADPAIRTAGEPYQPRPDLDHGQCHAQPRVHGLGYALWSGRRATAAAADVRRTRIVGRSAHLALHVARGTNVPRQHAGARRRLHRLDCALEQARHVRPANRSATCRNARAGRSAVRAAPDQAIPAADHGDRQQQLLHHAGTSGEDRRFQADQRDRRQRAISFHPRRMGRRGTRSLRPLRKLSPTRRAAQLHRRRQDRALRPSSSGR